MKYSEELERQWTITEKCLESEIKKLSEEFENVDPGIVNEALRKEKKRWENPSQVNCSWMDSLAKEHPDIAEKFRKVLDSLQFKSIEKISYPSNGKAVIGTIAATACAFGLFYYLKLPLTGTIILAGVTGVTTWLISSTAILKTKIIIRLELRNKLNEEVKNMGEKLKEVVSGI